MQFADGTSIPSLKVLNISCKAACLWLVKIALQVMTHDDYLAITTNACQCLFQLLSCIILSFVNDDNGIVQISTTQERIGNTGDISCAVLLINQAIIIDCRIGVDTKLNKRLIERLKIHARFLC